MKDIFKIIGILLIAAIVFGGLTYGFGWFSVEYSKTVGKSQQNANREVFEETNSFTRAKKQEIIKYYKEWQESETLEDKKAIESILSMSLADFDEDRFITNTKLLNWVKEVKY